MNWYFTDHELSFLPSLQGDSKISRETEAEYRRSTASFIQQAGIHLKVYVLIVVISDHLHH